MTFIPTRGLELGLFKVRQILLTRSGGQQTSNRSFRHCPIFGKVFIAGIETAQMIQKSQIPDIGTTAFQTFVALAA